MSSEVVVSIIIPTLNAEATLADALKSISSQTFKDIEVLIIDGESSDRTLEIVRAEKFQSIHVYSLPKMGIYEAMNFGVDRARGEWLMFLGADDRLFSPDVLETVFKDKRNSNYDVVYGDAFFDVRKGIYGGHFGPVSLLRRNICHQAIFYRRHLFESFGKFDVEYKVYADWVFNFKWFYNRGIKKKFLNKVISNYSEAGFSTRARDEAFERDRIAIARKYAPWYCVLIYQCGLMLKKTLRRIVG